MHFHIWPSDLFLYFNGKAHNLVPKTGPFQDNLHMESIVSNLNSILLPIRAVLGTAGLV